jgi:2-C-methyl-D-erythritol 4-phosphate cytidylyltransferase
LPTAAVILAWDAATLPGGAEPKLLTPLAGRPILEHSVAAFGDVPGVDEILVAAAPGLSGYPLASRTPLRVVEGGLTRTEAVRRALQAVREPGGNVLIHDANRPLLPRPVIEECLTALEVHEAVCAAVPASDTMVTIKDLCIHSRPTRDRLRKRQSPQGFRLRVIRRGYELAVADPGFSPSDDCAVVLRYLPEVPVHLVPGSEELFPITSALDVEIAEMILAARPPLSA